MEMAVLISIKPKFCQLIASGKKTIELRKSRPKTLFPFKCYIYCTVNDAPRIPSRYVWVRDKTGFGWHWNGMVIGEFVCDEIVKDFHGEHGIEFELRGCVPFEQQKRYAPRAPIYGWHISDLIIYDKPKELHEFSKHDPSYDKAIFGGHESSYPVKRPPQSWCYVNLIEQEAQL